MKGTPDDECSAHPTTDPAAGQYGTGSGPMELPPQLGGVLTNVEGTSTLSPVPAKRGRKPTSVPWSIRWPKPLLDRVRRAGVAERRSVPQMLKILVEEALSRRELGRPPVTTE